MVLMTVISCNNNKDPHAANEAIIPAVTKRLTNFFFIKSLPFSIRTYYYVHMS